MTDDFNFGSSNSPDPVQPPPASEIPPVPQVQPLQPEQTSAPDQGWLPPVPQQSQVPPAYQGVPQQQPYPPQNAQPQQPYPPYQQPYNYYQQQQPGYVPPYYPPPVSPTNSGDGMAVASLILGIISVVTCCVIYISAICAILSLIFGIIAKSKGSGGMAVAGIVLAAAGLVLSICLIIIAYASPDFINEIEHYGSEYTMMVSMLK